MVFNEAKVVCMSVSAIYAGSFDPITNGHLDIIYRALSFFDSLYVVVANNLDKHMLFSLEERLDMIHHSIGSTRVHIVCFDGLLVDFARQHDVFHIIRGVRSMNDFSYESQLAQVYQSQEPRIETIYLMANQKFSHISSRIVKQLVQLKGNIADFVPVYVINQLKDKYSGKN